MLAEPIAVTLSVVNALEELGIPYMIGGSLASAAYGVTRSTLDTDLIAELNIEQAEPLARTLVNDFYVDIEMIKDAIQHQSSFNIVHLKTMFKVDIFISKQRPYDRNQFQRRILQAISSDPETLAYLTTPEDIVLVKLEWYRMGNEVSDRQWRDILGVLTVQADRLDRDYLRKWAVELRVADLLQRAFKETELE